jgi:hypothetical protein
MYEFGSKLSVSLVDGMVEVHRLCGNRTMKARLERTIEQYHERYGYYPEVCVGIRSIGTREPAVLPGIWDTAFRPKLGRPFNEREKNRAILRERRRMEREDERQRIAVEGKFGEGKRRYSLDRIGTKLRETSESAIYLCCPNRGSI